MPIPWEKLDDMAAIEAYVAQCEAIRSGLGLLSRAEEFAAISEVCQRASGGAVRKFRALLEAQASGPAMREKMSRLFRINCLRFLSFFQSMKSTVQFLSSYAGNKRLMMKLLTQLQNTVSLVRRYTGGAPRQHSLQCRHRDDGNRDEKAPHVLRQGRHGQVREEPQAGASHGVGH